MPRIFDNGVLVGVWLLVILLLGGPALSYLNTHQLNEDARWVAHTHEVLDLTGEVMLVLVDAETGLRGFLIAGRDEFLRPYDIALTRLDDQIAKLRDKTEGNAQQQTRIAKLEGMVGVRLVSMKRTIALRRKGAEPEAIIAGIVRGKDEMDAIRRLVAEMQQEEHDLLEERERRSGTTYMVAVTSGMLTGLFGLLLLGLFVYLLKRSLLARQMATDRLRESEARKSAILETALDCILIIDHEGRIIEFNPASERTFGHRRVDVLGKPMAELLVPSSLRDQHHPGVSHYLATGEGPVLNRRIEVSALRADGSEFPVELAVTTTILDGLPTFTAYLRDITKRKQAEIDTQQREKRFRQLADAMPQIVWAARPDGYLDYYNRKWYELTGAEEGATGDQSWLPILHPDDRQKCLDLWYASVQSGQPYQIEYRFRFPETKEYRWHLGRALPVRDEQGCIVRWFGTCTDIHDQKRAEEQLRDLTATLEQRVEERTREVREHEERFRSAFDYAPIGFALVAPDGRWLRVNHSLCEIVGYEASELLATDFQTITHPDDLDIDLSQVRNMLAGKIRTYQMEKRYFHKQGHVIHILLSVSLIRDACGEPLYFISQIKDITQRKQAEAQLMASLREKEVLLKEIHHRVKNNLQIVSTLLDLQSDHTQDRQALEMFEESRGRVKSMAMIHERLYRSQDLARVNFAEYVRQLAEDLYHTYKVSDDEIVLHVEVAVPPLPIDIAIPCGLLVNELVSNCLKHGFSDSSEGWIRLTLQRDRASIILTVADNGAGFPPGFDFRNTTSFGLQLVNTLVEQLQGKVELNTDRGSEFVVTFPMKDNDPNGTNR